MDCPPPAEASAASVSRRTKAYIREVLHHLEAPPPVAARFFYSSPLALDDPLSPLPPQSPSAASKKPPRPFSAEDNNNLDRAWLDLRQKILRYNESGEKWRAVQSRNRLRPDEQQTEESESMEHSKAPQGVAIRQSGISGSSSTRVRDTAFSEGNAQYVARSPQSVDSSTNMGSLDTTRTPFLRAPSRSKREVTYKRAKPSAKAAVTRERREQEGFPKQPTSDFPGDSLPDPEPRKPAPCAKVPVGVSRLHNVVMTSDSIRMEPIYWHPVNDTAAVTRGTWFYKDSMLPVEVEVANLLESGYISMQVWTQTWKDELNSAVEVGALGEMKILHQLWPANPVTSESHPRTSSEMGMGSASVSLLEQTAADPEKERQELLESICDFIDVSNGANGPDSKAAGTNSFGRDGRKRLYPDAGVIYANDVDAYILRPSLQPSAYYGRRPLANYIRKGRTIGIAVCRGFDQALWNKLHPKEAAETYKRMVAARAASGARSGTHLGVTDLVLVIHGIGQKLSQRIESFHFTHAINDFRREVNVELSNDANRAHFRDGMGGIMVLPVNWRLSLSLEDEDYSDAVDPAANQFSLKDITPETLPSVRNIISDVMLDIPYYMSVEHHPKMISACIREANRIYRLWCANNPGFSEKGRVHLIAHSLGSVMAVDILSKQPTHVPASIPEDPTQCGPLPDSHFLFNTRSLFVCGSPVGFFLLLKKASLLPRKGRSKPGTEEDGKAEGVVGEVETYGCLAVDNIYNVINPYDPVAYRLNATVDVDYAHSLKTAFIPSASTPWLSFANPFRNPLSSAEAAVSGMKPLIPRLPSNVELETHNFTREEIAEKRAFLLNDNGQIDYFLKYGGGPLEIQYLTMLGAHSSYWVSRDFVRMVVVEVGRRPGKGGTILGMRALKKRRSV